MPSASRIDALSGSSRFAFSSGDRRLGRHAVAEPRRPSWKRSYASLIAHASSRSTSSRIAAATRAFGALGTERLAVGADEHDLVLGRVEADVRLGDVVEDDEVERACGRACRARARARPRRARRRSRRAPGQSLRRSPSACRTSSVGSSSTVHDSRVLRPLRRLGDGRPVVGDRGRHHDHVGVRARERLAGELLRRSAPARARPRRAAARRGWRRAASPRRRGVAPPRRARHPSGRTSGCRRSARRRAARGCRRPRRARGDPGAASRSRAASATAAAISSGSDIRPTPHSPSAISPSSGPMSSTPRSRRSAAFACVAGCDHMRGFIAGATRTGPRWASAASVRTLSARPWASFASVFAVNGAITSRSARCRCG